MKYYRLFLILVSFIFMSCLNQEELIHVEIVGDWKLEKIQEFDGLNDEDFLEYDYADTEIIFHFEPNGQLEISEDNSILEFGNYFYEVTSHDNISCIEIDGLKWNYALVGDNLILDRSFIFGPTVFLTNQF
ncbi:hypothetical protein [Aureivirga marina]|uniref:hypothetical protein n=1 Tax=Aureivirga marina TaxID=1182451 RepID=UPI0018CAA32B|nr:hypothetical protein [Aureivirga marina]